MASSTDLINKALRLIGASPIVNLTDGTTSANTADDIYEETRDSLLGIHPWNFAVKRQKLAQSSTAPTFEFDYAYPLPSDWLKTISVHDNDAGHGTILYRMELHLTQRAIITSSSEVYLRYVSRVSDVNLMSLPFRRALIYALARDLSIPLASSNTIEQNMAKHAERALAAARSADALGSFPELRPRGTWANSRGGRRRNEFLSD